MPTFKCSKCAARAEYQTPVHDARLWDYRCAKHKTPVHSKIPVAPPRAQSRRTARSKGRR